MKPCRTTQAGDSTWCTFCGLKWDTNESVPPRCLMLPQKAPDPTWPFILLAIFVLAVAGFNLTLVWWATR
jgi:hypothetical protein